MKLDLTVGPAKDGRRIAIISTGGHPQRPGSGLCTVLTLELVSEIPNGDTNAWFEQMKVERPWETRQ
jgi:hypothetical protein